MPGTPPAAAKFLALFDELGAAEASAGHRSVSFQLSEDEVNEYMRYSLATTPRPGLHSMTLKLFAHNYISAVTVADFDAVESWRPGTVPALLKPVLRGKKSIWVDCRFRVADGKLAFSIEKAYYEKIRLPALLVEKMIAIVAARQPEEYDTTKPLPLPFGLRQVWTAERLLAGRN
jgi:hypothetical protein